MRRTRIKRYDASKARSVHHFVQYTKAAMKDHTYPYYFYANFNAQTSQLWPPQWKKDLFGKDGPAKTFKEKMMEKAQAAAEIAAKKAAEAAEAARKKVQDKLAENFDGIKSTAEEEAEKKKREQELAEEEEDDEDILLARKKKKSKWKRKLMLPGKYFTTTVRLK